MVLLVTYNRLQKGGGRRRAHRHACGGAFLLDLFRRALCTNRQHPQIQQSQPWPPPPRGGEFFQATGLTGTAPIVGPGQNQSSQYASLQVTIAPFGAGKRMHCSLRPSCFVVESDLDYHSGVQTVEGVLSTIVSTPPSGEIPRSPIDDLAEIDGDAVPARQSFVFLCGAQTNASGVGFTRAKFTPLVPVIRSSLYLPLAELLPHWRSSWAETLRSC